MLSTLSCYVNRFDVLPAERIFGPAGETHRRRIAADTRSIYFIVKTKKLRFAASRCHIGFPYKVRCLVKKGQKSYRTIVDMAHFWFSMDENKNAFSNKQEMALYYLRRCEPAWVRRLPPSIRYTLGSRIISSSSTSELEISCAIKQCLSRERDGNMSLFIYQMAMVFDWPILDDLTILYIGKSRDTFKRVKGHENWGRILASLSDDEDALVYFMNLEANHYIMESPNDARRVRIGEPIDLEILTSVSEAAMIHYFKPDFNDHYKSRDIFHTGPARQAAALGYDDISIEVMLDGVMGRVGTPGVGYGKHSAKFHLRSRDTIGDTP